MITIPTVAYRVLYYQFRETFHAKFLQNETLGWDITGPSLWNVDKERFQKEVLRNLCRVNPNYFYKFYLANKPDRAIYCKMKTEALACLLSYIGYNLDPSSINDSNVKDLLRKFMADYESQIKIEILTQRMAYISFIDDFINDLNGMLSPEERIAHDFKRIVPDFDTELNRFHSEKTDMISRHYLRKLANKEFYFYFHSFNQFKVDYDETKAKERAKFWTLYRLKLEFKGEVKGNLAVDLTNITDHEHTDYEGNTMFSVSDEGLIVVLMRARSHRRFLALAFQFGEGDLHLGQYLNYQSGPRVVSGTFVLKRPERGTTIKPIKIQVPYLESDAELGSKEYKDVDKSILRYLHDERLNFRRTPTRVKNSLHSLETWLKSWDERRPFPA